MDEAIVQEIYEEIFLHVQKHSVDVFLCGGVDKTKHKRDKLRRDLERLVLEEKNSKYKLKIMKVNIFYPEDLFKEIMDKKRTISYSYRSGKKISREVYEYDLLTLENLLADSSDFIVIICESPGSIAELGAFTNNKDTMNKILVLLEEQYEKGKSFIRRGPVDYILSKDNEYNKENVPQKVISYNLNEKDDQTLVKEVKRFLEYRYKRKDKKDVNMISGQVNFILLLLYFFETVEKNEMDETVKKYYQKVIKDKKDFFSIINGAALERLFLEGLIEKEVHESKEVYKLSKTGYNMVKDVIHKVNLDKRDNRDSRINGIRMKILSNQYC